MDTRKGAWVTGQWPAGSRTADLLAAALALVVLGVPLVAGGLQASGTVPSVAGQASIVNARTETRSAARGLAGEVKAVSDRGTATWIGYRVPIVRGRDATFSSTGTCCGRCRLAPSDDLLVLARIEGQSILELRASAVDCDLDAGGMPLVWLNDVKPEESVTWLTSLVNDGTAGGRQLERIARPALTALALHEAASAGATLIALARGGSSAELRGQALFWLAQRAADQAAATITDAIDRDPDIEVKKKAVFALSNLPKDQSVPMLIDLVRSNRSREVRRQAMFWLGQSNDPRATEFFAQILLK